MVVCVVPGCGSNSKKTSKYSFHLVPTSLIRRAHWVIALGPLPRRSHVCSRHFEANMIKKCGDGLRLMQSAVPKLFLDSPSYRSNSPTAESSHSSECCEEADEASSEELVACRACLAAEGRLYAISGSGFEDALAALTGVTIPEAECFPQHLCAFCCTILAKLVAFRDSCQRSTALLQSQLEKGPLKISDITAIDRDAHHLSNKLTRIKVFQFGTSPIAEVMPLIKTENNDNSYKETDCIEAEYLESDACENNDSNDEYKCTYELPKAKQEKTKKVQSKCEKIEIKKSKTKFDDLQLETDDDMETNDEYDKYNNSDVDTDTSEETFSIRQRVALILKNPIKTTKKEENYELPPPIDIKAFEEKYNVEYKCLNLEEQKQEIEERKANNALRYCCDMCGQGHKQERSMVNHMWTHDPRMGPFECEVCRKRLRTSAKLRWHRCCHRDQFTCRECGLVSRARIRVISHHKVHQGGSHACPHCKEVYVRQSSLYNHIRTRHPEQNVPCDECGETFLSALGVQRHKSLAHIPIAKEILKCKECDVTFSSAEALQRHSALGAGVPHAALWACAACGDSCGSEPALAAHAAERHPPDQLHCDECDKTFANEAAFSLHEARKHRGERATPLMNTRPFRRIMETGRRRKAGTGPRLPGTGPHRPGTKPRRPSTELVCEICGKTTLNIHTLEYHRNAHLGIKPFSCQLCDKKFTGKTNLQIHMLVHTGKRPHQCEHCQQSFSLKSNLNRHISSVHFRTTVTCEICGKSVGTTTLQQHVRSVHLNIKPVRRKRDRKNAKTLKRSQSDQSPSPSTPSPNPWL